MSEIRQPRFYVYALVDETQIPRYIGKGSGGRLRAQERRTKLTGVILRRFHDEQAAYRYEVEMIALYTPELNRNPGGGGKVVSKVHWMQRRAKARARQRRYWAKNKRQIQMRRKKVFAGYGGLVEALIKRRKQLGWTVEFLDERAGFPKGYATKLENFDGPQGRVAGAVTLPLWLQALGLGFVPVPMVDGNVQEQAKALAQVARPQLNGADLQKRPRR